MDEQATAKQSKLASVIILILDSVGVGALPDAALYNDEGSNTLSNTANAAGGLNLPNLSLLGLGNIVDIRGVHPVSNPLAAFGKMAEKSAGKDTITGHWELMGLYLPEPFPTYPNGFPKEVIDNFEKRIHRKVLGNKPASGTEIIQELGEAHLNTSYPIVYTSADSVFQIAAHEEIITRAQLYEMCKIARTILTGKHNVARVIARPFVGMPGNFTRTEGRKDFSVEPPRKTVLDYASENNVQAIGIGKIGELFSFRGISQTIHTLDNLDSINQTLLAMKSIPSGLIFTNLVDFDMLWGHRNDPKGYAKELEATDKRVPEFLNLLKEEDVLIITADHGCDPTTASTDHSREYVPLLVFGKKIRPVSLGTRTTFADVGKTVAQLLGFEAPLEGKSFADEVLNEGL